MSTLCYGNELIVHYEGNEIRVWNSQESRTFCDRRWICKHQISCVTVQGSEILFGTLTGSLWSLQMIAGSDLKATKIPTPLPEDAITHVRSLNETTILIFKGSRIHRVRWKTKQNPQKAITNRDCFFLDIDNFLKAQQPWVDEQGNSGFVFLDVSFTGYVFLADTKGTTLLGNLMTRVLTPIATNFLSACFLFTSSTKVTYVLSSTTASTYQINTIDVESEKIQYIWGDKELESGCQFEEQQSITAYNGKIARVQGGYLEVQDFNHLRNTDGPLHFDRIIHFAGCSVGNVIHGALLVENRELQKSIYTWTYSNGEIKPYLLQPISHNEKYTRIARNESLIAVCSETQKKKMTSFVDVLIWQKPFKFQRIPVSSEVIDFTKHSADSFCVATQTEIILVDEKNFEIEKYEECAIAVRYNHHTKGWKRLLRTKVTYKDYHENEQVKNYVIDPCGQNWIIITSEGVLTWYREGERKSKRSNVSESLILLGFLKGEKVITYDESNDPTIRCYTLRCEEEEEEEEEEKSEQNDFVEEESDSFSFSSDSFSSDENEFEEESDENESDENLNENESEDESGESESDENKSDENESEEESDENESEDEFGESDENESDESNENESDENERSVNFTLFAEDKDKHDWEIQECLGLSTIHVVDDVIFLVTPEDLSVLENQEVRNLLKTDSREEYEFA